VPKRATAFTRRRERALFAHGMAMGIAPLALPNLPWRRGATPRSERCQSPSTERTGMPQFQYVAVMTQNHSIRELKWPVNSCSLFEALNMATLFMIGTRKRAAALV
jgi:hypothetical protein